MNKKKTPFAVLLALLAGLGLSSLVLSGADGQELSATERAARRDKEKLQGTWTTVSVAEDATGVNGGEDKDDTITYDGNRYICRRGGRVWQAGTFSIVDAAGDPRKIDYRCTEGEYKGMNFLSIYSVDSDSHRICSVASGKDRPKEFSSKAGFLRVTRRQKP